MPTWFLALVMGAVEGLTEFIPVSSTGHLILASEILGFEGPPGKTFEIAIQLGAILAVCFIYRTRLVNAVLGFGRDASATRFALNILIAFLPAMVIGFFAHSFIKNVLFSPWVVAVMLVVGGLVILVIERNLPRTTTPTVDDMRPVLALKIGLFQCVAMIPGVSRSGATIMGSLLLGLSRPAAAEFSFFLAIPTMVAATTYDLWKNRAFLSLDDAGTIAIGFGMAFLCGLLVVRALVAFVSRHGFVPFAWYRIALGAAALVGLYLVSS